MSAGELFTDSTVINEYQLCAKLRKELTKYYPQLVKNRSAQILNLCARKAVQVLSLPSLGFLYIDGLC